MSKLNERGLAMEQARKLVADYGDDPTGLLVGAIAAAIVNARALSNAEPAGSVGDDPALYQCEFEDGSIDHYAGVFGLIHEVNGKKVVRRTPLYARHQPSSHVVEALREAADYIDATSGAALGLAMSGSDHPDPDGVLMGISRDGVAASASLRQALAAIAAKGARP
jgi:hypothetical protein